jgi:hypothetical protein
MKKLVIVAMLVLLTFMLITQLSCGKEEESPTSESNRWLELLRVLPANESTLKSAYLEDITFSMEKIEKYPDILAGYEIMYPLPFSGYGRDRRYDYSDEELKQTLGFVSTDVDQKIRAGTGPQNYYQAVRGRFSREDIDSTVKTGPMNDILEVVSYQGYEFYSWGGDHEIHLSRRSNIRPLGMGYRLALVDDFLFWVAWTDGMKEMIDSYEDNIDSLADEEDYKLLTEALEEFDVDCVFLSNDSYSQSHVREVVEEKSDVIGEIIEEIANVNLLKPYQALATGASIDEDGFYLVIALANPSEAVARQNATLLEQRINEVIEFSSFYNNRLPELIESMETESEGRLTLAKLRGDVYWLWQEFEISAPGIYLPLLMHE